jgi:iron complex outermembrane receptor protein
MQRHATPRKLSRAIQAALLSLTLTATFITDASAAESALNSPATRSYQMPAGPLGRSLVNVAAGAGIALSFDPALTEGRSSPALTGNYTVREALHRLLTGSELELVAKPDGSYTLRKAEPAPVTSQQTEAATTLAEVEVAASAELPGDRPKAYAGGQVARGGRVGVLGDKDAMDTPFSITAYTQQLMQDQQASTLADVIANEPSMRSTNPRGGRFDQFSIRGFRLVNSEVAMNGLFGLVPTYSTPVEGAERVEILKGPNALLNGMAPSGAVGGTVNMVTKRATDEPVTQLTASYGNEAQGGVHLDVGRRFGADHQFGARVNLVHQDGDTSFSDQTLERSLATLGLDFRGERLRLSGDLQHQERRGTAPMERVRVLPGAAIPDADKIDSNFAQDWTYANSRDTMASARGEFDLTENITTYAAFGARRGQYDFMRINPVEVNSAGNFSARADKFLREENAVSGEAGIRAANFTTGPIRHQLNLGVNMLKFEFGNARLRGATISSNIYNPVDRPEPVITLSDSVPRTGETELTSVALTDTLSWLDDRFQLTLGARQQRAVVKSYAENGTKTSEYDKNALTPAVALLVKANDRVSLYGNYIEALSQGPTAPLGAENEGQVFAPSKTRQVEAGIKFDGGRIASTLSIFRIEEPSGFTNAATNVFGVDGEQRNTGMEWNVFGAPTANTRVLGGLMWLDGELTKTRDGAFDGNTAIGVARLNANLGGEWDTPFLPGLTLTARVIYTSDQYLDQANTQEIPDWTRVDIGARYVFTQGDKTVTLRANVDNLFDKRYWESATEFGMSFGAPRTAIVSATIDF